MAYDEGLVQRMREMIEDQPMLDEKKMFGGAAFMINGNVACGVVNDELIVRVGPDLYEKSLKQDHVKVFDFTGRPMQGWIMVQPGGYETDKALRDWVEKGIKFALTLPPK